MTRLHTPVPLFNGEWSGHYCDSLDFPANFVDFGPWTQEDFRTSAWTADDPDRFNPLFWIEKLFKEHLEVFFVDLWDSVASGGSPDELTWVLPPASAGHSAHTLLREECARVCADPNVAMRRIAQLMLQKQNVS